MAVKNLKNITPTYWVPPKYYANFKMTVERIDGSIDDITDILLNWKIEDGVTEGIGIFEFTILNPNETYTKAWTGMEIFRYYCDYTEPNPGDPTIAVEPTTLRFRGRIEKPSNQDNNIHVTGRSETLFVQDREVTKEYINKDAGYIIKDLFDTYGGGRYDTSAINVSTGQLLTLTFSELAFWDAIEDICYGSGYDCYVSAALIVQFFESSSITNTTEGIVHDYNLQEVRDFAPDVSFVKNKIRVIGGTIDNVQIIYTANDFDSQDTYGIRQKTINDDGIVTFDAAKDLGDYILQEYQNPPIVGEVKGLLLATIQPGENIRVSSPTENIPPGPYRCVHYILEGGLDGEYITATLNKEPRKISHVLKARIQREHRKNESSGNPSNLDFSYIELFNAAAGTHYNTEISEGVLKLTSGSASGYWIGPKISTANLNNISQARLSIYGDNLLDVKLEFSPDNGLTYEVMTKDTMKSIGATGKDIRLRITLNSSTTQIDSLQIQYSTT